ncbi:hypothetical protein IW262DRAFT_1269390, partial [Armillaria fumosa]
VEFRMYVMCPVLPNGDARAFVVFSTHKLAVERLKWADQGRQTVARHCRLCRPCEGAVEMPEHALLQFHPPTTVTQLRQDFLKKVWAAHPQVLSLYRTCHQTEFLQCLLGQEKIVLPLKSTYCVLQVFYLYPLHRP